MSTTTPTTIQSFDDLVTSNDAVLVVRRELEAQQAAATSG